MLTCISEIIDICYGRESRNSPKSNPCEWSFDGEGETVTDSEEEELGMDHVVRVRCRWPMDLIDHSSQSASVPKWCPTFTDEVTSPDAEQAAASSKWYKVAVCIRDTETVCDSFSIHHVLVGDILPLYVYLYELRWELDTTRSPNVTESAMNNASWAPVRFGNFVSWSLHELLNNCKILHSITCGKLCKL